MNAFELNKIAAAVLLAGVIAMTTGLIAKLLVSQPHHFESIIQATGQEAAQPSGGGAEEMPPIANLLADADPAAGQKSTSKCTACHSFEKGGPNKVGPDLYGIVGRDIAHHEGFSYSSALSDMEGSWDYEKLNHFLYKPREFAPGTKMSFAGLSKPEERANVIAYLRTLNDNPPPLPEPVAEPAKEGAAAPADAAAPGGAATEGAAKEAAPAGGDAAPAPGTATPNAGGDAAKPTTDGSAPAQPQAPAPGDATGGGSSGGLGAQGQSSTANPIDSNVGNPASPRPAASSGGTALEGQPTQGGGQDAAPAK